MKVAFARFAVLAGMGVILAGCPSPPVATEVIGVQEVLDQLKLELNAYQVANLGVPDNFPACGTGKLVKLGMRISGITVTLNLVGTRITSQSANIGVIPMNFITPKFDASREVARTSTQTITLDLGLKADKESGLKALAKDFRAPDGSIAKKNGYGIFNALVDLRTALLQTNHLQQPCLSLNPNRDKPGTKLKIAFGVKRTIAVGGSAGFVLELIPISLGGKYTDIQDDTQTIEMVLNFNDDADLLMQ